MTPLAHWITANPGSCTKGQRDWAANAHMTKGQSTMTDLAVHLTRQIVFSRATFGPGARTKGVTDHIRKELLEVDESNGSPSEWTDVAILALDGLTRSTWAAHPGWTAEAVAEKAVNLIVGKQGKNELRNWPDWRGADPDKAIEHQRGHHD